MDRTIATHGQVLPWHLARWRQMQSARSQPQALLIVGPEGSGLPQFALALIQARLCRDPGEDGIACGRCRDCDWFASGHHPDVLRIGNDVALAHEAEGEGGDGKAKGSENQDAAKSRNIPVSEIRRVTGFLQVASHGEAGRFVILSPADGMNAAAGNALLKILEEPPTRTTLVLASSRETRLLPTVRSRCQLVRLARPERSEALGWIAAQGVPKAALALDLSGQAPMAAASLDPEFWAARDRMVAALARADGASQRLVALGELLPIGLLVQLLHTWVCDCLMSAGAGRIRYHTDQSAAIARAALRQDTNALMAFEQRLRDARRLVDHPLNPKLVAGDLLLAYAACELPS